MSASQKYSLFIFFLVNYVLIAQSGNLKGFAHFSNNDPVLGAYVALNGNAIKRETSTNIDGDFVFKNIPYGTYHIEIHSLNAKPKTVEVVIKEAEQTVNIVLQITEHQDLQEILVQTKTEKRKIEDEGFAVNVIETKEASIRNIQTNELLNTTVGVKIRQNGGLGSNVQYMLNGLSGSAVRIFIDGIPISIYGSSFSLNSIPPSMIKRIEVYKGVVPGHLADDALGGAINIVLQNATKPNFDASVSYGSFNTFQTSVNGLYRFEKSGFTIKASAFHNYSDNDYKVWGRSIADINPNSSLTPITARRFNDAYRSTGGMVQVGYTDVEWADQFYVGLTGSDDYKEIQHGAFMTHIPYYGRFMESDAMLANLTYKKKDLFFKGLDVDVNGLHGKRNRMVNDTVPWIYTWRGVKWQDGQNNNEPKKHIDESQQEGGPTLAKINRNVTSVRTGVSYAINKNHKVLFNHVYSRIDREDSDALLSLLENTFRGTRDLHKNILSATYELNALNGKLQANVFGKYYQQKTVNIDPYVNESTNEIEDEIISANAKNEGYGFALSYAIIPNVTLLTSAEKAIRLPNESEVFGNDGDNVVANPSIRPELSNNYNLGFRFGSFNIKKHDFSISTNFFTRNIKDRIGLPIERTPDEELILYENQGHGTSKGVDAQLNYTYNNNLGFNFNISRFELLVVNRGVEIDVPNTPFFTMNGNLRYSFKDLIQKKSQLNLFYTMYFTDAFSYLPPQGSHTSGLEFFEVPQQISQDFGVSYTFPKNKLIMSFDVKNIFNEAIYDNLSVQKPGRAFYLKLNYFINKF